jgi:hypothetical protein
MTTDRSRILNQLADGVISADEAARRLNPGAASAGTASAGQAGFELPPHLAGRWLRVHVTDLHTERTRVKVSLPMSWVAAGLKIGARYAPQVANINLAELLSELQAGSSGRLVDVEDLDEGQKVEIFVD